VKYFILITSRALSGLLDVAGIALIGLIAGLAATNLDPNKPLVIAGITLPPVTENTLVWLVIAVLAVFTIKAVLAVWLSWVLADFLSRVEQDKATEIAASLFGQDLAELQGLSKSEIIWAVMGSTYVAFSGLLVSLGTFVSEGLLLILISVTFFLVDPIATVFVVLYFGILVLVIQRVIGGSLKRAGEASSRGNIDSVQYLEDLLNAFREISILQKLDFFLNKFRQSRGRLARGNAQMTFLAGMPRYVVETALMLGVVVFVGFQFVTGQLASGLVTVGVFLTGGVRIMASLLPLQNAAASVKNQTEQARLSLQLLETINSPTRTSNVLIENAETLEPKDRIMTGAFEVKLRNINFTYTDATSPALSNISLDIRRGQHVAVIGPSGAGKTTLVDLILGLITPDTGEVLIDGNSPALAISSQPGKISYVPQSPGIVSGTIAENVALGTDINDIDESQVQSALKKAGLTELIESLPDGIYTSVGSQADSFSGGQIQRLGFARALYEKPSLIILDEATSALDASSEAHLSSSIKDLGAEVTVIVIAHRLSTVQHSDVVFLMEQGSITAQGTFAHLRRTVPMVAEYVRLMSFDEQIESN
jgi:ATP-binding cassette subfamily C protein